MSALIKGVEMPKRQILAVINPNGLVEVLAGNTLIAEFEAVPVPPHGDLIDRDALINDLVHAEFFSMTDYNKFVSLALKAPTIIPAEEGEA